MADLAKVKLIESLLSSSESGNYGSFFNALGSYKPTPMSPLRLPNMGVKGPRATPKQIARIAGHLTGKTGGGPAAGTAAAVIAANAKKFGLDPAAVLAYALEESGGRWGAVGDTGTSYGPFQFHRGGALGTHTSQWAMSPAGLIAGMRMMSQAGAKGLTGEAAVRAIYKGFGKGTPTAVPKGVAQYQRAVNMLARKGQQMVSGNDVVVVPTRFTATHDTDGIPGYQPSIDITAVNGRPVKPGEAVLAPEDGSIFRYGHAQGGHALYFKGKSGRVYWIGHIENAGPLRRYRRGQRIASISAHHATPHVHVGILSG